MTLCSVDSSDSEMAGSKSVPRSTKRMVSAPMGRGIPAIVYIIIAAISATLLVNVYAINFFRLSNINRPVDTKYKIYFHYMNHHPISSISTFLLKKTLTLLAQPHART